jgi:uncharacterized protein YbbC (DUF1343 family)
MTVATGLDRLLRDMGGLVRGQKVALLAHPASVDGKLRSAHEVLERAGAEVVVLLGPEHGLDGEAQDMEGVVHLEAGHKAEPRIYSLYGETEASLRPTAEMLEGVELLVIDLQDIGTRYYTFAWTAALCLEVCAELVLPALVLDRPNPLGGELVEGPPVEAGFSSFVGHHDLPVRHGLTLGEVLRLFVRERKLEVDLKVLPMEGWNRSWWFDETGLPWVMPSPNMPTAETALVYPGMCLVEGTNLSEGRGTTRPFELVGAPWIDGDELARRLNSEELPGCVFRPLSFKPMFHKHAGQRCGGVQTHVIDRGAFRPLRTGVALIRAAWQLGQGRMAWRRQPYEFVSDRLAIDLLAGGSWLRLGVEGGDGLSDICQGFGRQARAFLDRRDPDLLYR